MRSDYPPGAPDFSGKKISSGKLHREKKKGFASDPTVPAQGVQGFCSGWGYGSCGRVASVSMPSADQPSHPMSEINTFAIKLRWRRQWGAFLAGVAVIGLTTGVARAAEGDRAIAAVSSHACDDYVRSKLPDGTFQAETYAFGPGGRWDGRASDDTIDKLNFTAIARVIAGPLAVQKYLPAGDPKTTKLLIMVYWGTTIDAGGASSSIGYSRLSSASERMGNARAVALVAANASHGTGGSEGGNENDIGALREKEAADAAFDAALAVPLAENRARDLVTRQNASMLGFDSAWLNTTGHESRRQDLIEELEESRYFVVLMAYDFQTLWKEKKRKLLWETRYSIRAGRNAFDRELLGMTQTASRYFGQESHGLVRKPMPEGHIRLGELKFGEIQDPDPSPSPSP